MVTKEQEENMEEKCWGKRAPPLLKPAGTALGD